MHSWRSYSCFFPYAYLNYMPVPVIYIDNISCVSLQTYIILLYISLLGVIILCPDKYVTQNLHSLVTPDNYFYI